jgi:hypothetical protein
MPKLVPYYVKTQFTIQIISKIIASTNSVDEVNSIAYASI